MFTQRKIAELESQLHALGMQRENMNNKIEDMAARLHTYSKVGRVRVYGLEFSMNASACGWKGLGFMV